MRMSVSNPVLPVQHFSHFLVLILNNRKRRAIPIDLVAKDVIKIH